MIIGPMKHRITIKEPEAAQDTMGGDNPTYKKYAEVWASINPLTGKEFWESQKENSEVQGMIEIRYLSGLKSDMIIEFGSKTFEIISIKHPEESKKRLHILYKEVVP